MTNIQHKNRVEGRHNIDPLPHSLIRAERERLNKGKDSTGALPHWSVKKGLFDAKQKL